MKVNVTATDNLGIFIKKLENAERSIVAELLSIGENEADKHILKGYAADGNTDVYTDSVSAFGGGKVSISGDDVAYQEFGYGMPAQGSPHPKKAIGYSPTSKAQWVYWDNGIGKYRTSHGMPPQMPIYRAGRVMRLKLKGVIEKYV